MGDDYVSSGSEGEEGDSDEERDEDEDSDSNLESDAQSYLDSEYAAGGESSGKKKKKKSIESNESIDIKDQFNALRFLGLTLKELRETELMQKNK